MQFQASNTLALTAGVKQNVRKSASGTLLSAPRAAAVAKFAHPSTGFFHHRRTTESATPKGGIAQMADSGVKARSIIIVAMSFPTMHSGGAIQLIQSISPKKRST